MGFVKYTHFDKLDDDEKKKLKKHLQEQKKYLKEQLAAHDKHIADLSKPKGKKAKKKKKM